VRSRRLQWTVPRLPLWLGRVAARAGLRRASVQAIAAKLPEEDVRAARGALSAARARVPSWSCAATRTRSADEALDDSTRWIVLGRLRGGRDGSDLRAGRDARERERCVNRGGDATMPRAHAHTTLATMILAIDGPAGSGKSTVARRLAQRLGLTFLDTGAMYRAVTLAALERGVDPMDAEGCAQAGGTLRLTFDAQGPDRAADGRAASRPSAATRSRAGSRPSRPTAACAPRSCRRSARGACSAAAWWPRDATSARTSSRAPRPSSS
jgi:hypothetical protein